MQLKSFGSGDQLVLKKPEPNQTVPSAFPQINCSKAKDYARRFTLGELNDLPGSLLALGVHLIEEGLTHVSECPAHQPGLSEQVRDAYRKASRPD